MIADLSQRSRAIVAESLPMMERNRGRLDEALVRYMARQGPYHPSAGRSEETARALSDMLFGRVRQFAGKGQAVSLFEAGRRNRALGLGGEHYSSFGDALKPIMIDVLGTEATPSVIAAWIDAYWAIVRALRQETRLAA